MKITVYPEYYKGEITGESVEIFGKHTECGKSRMYLYHNGEEKISYDKILSDGNNIEGDSGQKMELYEDENIAIGLVCCMDVNNSSFLKSVKELLANSACKHKIIAISAYMTSDWFGAELISPDFHDYVVALSNGNENGVPSFIAGKDGYKITGTNYEEDALCICEKSPQEIGSDST